MPNEVRIQVHNETFHASGDFAFDAGFLEFFRAWLEAISDTTDQTDAQIASLNTSQDRLAAAVAAATPTEPEATKPNKGA